VERPDRVNPHYEALATWCAARLDACARRPWVLGIQGPQGCGKTTLATAVVAALGRINLRAVAVSIDDFYLTHGEQQALAQRLPSNRYLQYRGYPGTHDVALGAQVIASIIGLAPGEETFVPVYRKSAHGGRGDRAPRSRVRAGHLTHFGLESGAAACRGRPGA